MARLATLRRRTAAATALVEVALTVPPLLPPKQAISASATPCISFEGGSARTRLLASWFRRRLAFCGSPFGSRMGRIDPEAAQRTVAGTADRGTVATIARDCASLLSIFAALSFAAALFREPALALPARDGAALGGCLVTMFGGSVCLWAAASNLTSLRGRSRPAAETLQRAGGSSVQRRA